MNDRDPLDLAVRALRESGEPPPEDVARTRARMLETLQRGERRSRRTFWVVLPIAAVLAASTALAKNSDVLRRAWKGVATTVGIAETQPAPLAHEPSARRGALPASSESVDPTSDLAVSSPEATALHRSNGEGAPSSSDTQELAPVAPLDHESAHPRGVMAPSSRSTRLRREPTPSQTTNPPPELAAKESSATSAPSAEAAINEAEAASLALYKKAYHLHFVEHRYAAGLVAWDEYLRDVPGGRLTVEARYNRAIALVRLGRRQEAEMALQPFARGEVGNGYRMREARDLLGALGTP